MGFGAVRAPTQRVSIGRRPDPVRAAKAQDPPPADCSTRRSPSLSAAHESLSRDTVESRERRATDGR